MLCGKTSLLKNVGRKQLSKTQCFKEEASALEAASICIALGPFCPLTHGNWLF